MQIKAMMRCHHTTVGMTIIKKTRGSVEEDVKKKGALLHGGWDCKLMQSL